MRNLKVLMSILLLGGLLTGACAPAATTQAPVATQAPASTSAPAATQAPATAATQAPAAAVEPIKLGAVYPLTGSVAVNGQAMVKAHEFAVNQINAAGGIKCLGGAKLQMVYGDHQGNIETGNAETERLITSEHVIVLMGPYDSGNALTGTQIAERYQIPYLVSVGLASDVTKRGLQYAFKTGGDMDAMSLDMVKYAYSLGAKSGLVWYPNFTYGELYSKSLSSAMSETGMQEVGNLRFQGGASDYTDLILKTKAADPDVLFNVCDTSDCVLQTQQMQELHYLPKGGIMMNAGSVTDPSFLKALGNKGAEGILMTGQWYPSLNTPGNQDTIAAYKNAEGVDLSNDAAITYATTWIVAAALEKSCSRDPKQLDLVLHTSRFDTGPWNILFPYVEFDSTGMNETTTNYIAQFQNGQTVPVFPSKYAAGKVEWPAPAWSAR
jgi:branched-chain amino acid transport system substrate-binding protein